MKEAAKKKHETRIRSQLEKFATETRLGNSDVAQAKNANDVTVVDVLPRTTYRAADAYRRSWEELTSFCSFGPLDQV
jgi:hypothetical protein